MQKQNEINTELIAEILQTHISPMYPPGCFTEIVLHPSGLNDAIEIGIVQEHRFAFFYWLKWYQENKSKGLSSPHLVTVDWHNDVGCAADFFPEIINKLDDNTIELAIYSWYGLRQLNDGHIAPAMYLNAINDVYVILKQEHNQRSETNPFIDKFGNQHMVHYYYSTEDFLNAHEQDEDYPLIFDLDLDYFTEQKDRNNPTYRDITLVSNQEIHNIMNNSSRFMHWLFRRMCGMTIALEPKYCGGIHNCLQILNTVSSCLFDPPLLQPECRWKHLNYN